MRLRHLLGLLTITFALVAAKPAKAEAPIPEQFNSIFQMLDDMILQGSLIPTTIGGVGCAPTFQFGFPTMSLKFSGAAGCPMKGTVTFSVIPFGASVRLEFMNNPYIQALDVDFAMSLKRNSGGARQLSWKITNGRIAFRMQPNAPLNEWGLTGEGVRTTVKKSITANARLNFFDKATGNGNAIVRSMTWNKPDPKVKNVQGCSLSGATMDNAQSGTLSNCGDLR